MRYIRMKPDINEMPIQACGSWCECVSSANRRDRRAGLSKRDGSSRRSACPAPAWGISFIGSTCGERAELLYIVSMPSGIIMIRHVPTRRPVPMAEIIREWFCERPKLSGSEPARNDLPCMFSDCGHGRSAEEIMLTPDP